MAQINNPTDFRAIPSALNNLYFEFASSFTIVYELLKETGVIKGNDE